MALLMTKPPAQWAANSSDSFLLLAGMVSGSSASCTSWAASASTGAHGLHSCCHCCYISPSDTGTGTTTWPQPPLGRAWAPGCCCPANSSSGWGWTLCTVSPLAPTDLFVWLLLLKTQYHTGITGGSSLRFIYGVRALRVDTAAMLSGVRALLRVLWRPAAEVVRQAM